jgi:hypothetical protein
MFAAYLLLISCFASFSTLKMVAICSFETYSDFYRTTCLYIPEDRNFRYVVNLMSRVSPVSELFNSKYLTSVSMVYDA